MGARSRATVESILACLPQTQCARCGHPGCRPYAEAIGSGAAINRCPPGGDATIAALARLLDRDPLPLDAALDPAPPDAVAFVREDECIGCFKCVRACPVDAIVGAPHFLHTVIESECTGCGLCLPPCPVDCIELHEQAPRWSPERARERFDARAARLEREKVRAVEQREQRRQAAAARAARALEVRAAVERVRARRRAAAAPAPDGDDEH